MFATFLELLLADRQTDEHGEAKRRILKTPVVDAPET
jgi:hypothetical protein